MDLCTGSVTGIAALLPVLREARDQMPLHSLAGALQMPITNSAEHNLPWLRRFLGR